MQWDGEHGEHKGIKEMEAEVGGAGAGGRPAGAVPWAVVGGAEGWQDPGKKLCFNLRAARIP